MKQSWKIEIFKKNNLGRLKKKGRMGDANLTKLYDIKKYQIKLSHKFYSLNYKIAFLRKKKRRAAKAACREERRSG